MNDTFSIVYDKASANKVNHELLKNSEFFDEVSLFLPSGNDSFIIGSNDSIVAIDKLKFKIYAKSFSEFGDIFTEQEFGFNTNGILISKKLYFDQKNVIPKIYSSSMYSNIKFYKSTPGYIDKLMKLECNKATYLLKINNKNIKPSIPYHRIVKKLTISKLKPVIRKNEYYRLDSIFKSAKFTLVYFWFLGCAPCNKIQPELSTLYNKYDSVGLTLIGLNNVDRELDIYSKDSVFLNYFDKYQNMNLFARIGYPLVILVNNRNEIIGELNGYSESGLVALKEHLMELFLY